MPRAATGKSSPVRPEETWSHARLIPAIGVRAAEEQEKRATSSLLAVMRAVPEFGRAVLAELGAAKGRISAYAEIQFRDADGRTHIPDGVIVTERGSSRWRCLVEVKTGGNELKPEQVNRYLDVARENQLDAVLTISNQITPAATTTPVDVDRRKTKNVGLFHLSWWGILTAAIVQHRHRGLSDPDQAWILGELIAYLDDERSGAGGFQDMGDQWVTVRNAAAAGTLRQGDAGVRDVAERWDQFVEYLCLGLAQDLGRDINPVRPRKETDAARIDTTVKGLADEGKLQASFRVPDAVGPITVEADLRTRRVTTSVVVDAPTEGRATTRVNWLLRQIAHAPDDLRVEARFPNVRETTAQLLQEAKENPRDLLFPSDPKRPPRSFLLALSRQMGTKRGKGERSFVRDTRQQAVGFYREIVQDLRVWQPSAPKLPAEPAPALTPPSPSPPPFAAEGARDPGEAKPPASLRSPFGSTDESERSLLREA